MGRRRDDRLEINLPVRVWGMDRNGKPFIQSAHTVDVTRTGGRIRDLYCMDKKGDVIRIQHGLQKANFRVTWVGNPGTAEAGHVGIHCIEPDKYIWGVNLPKRVGPDPFQVVEDVEIISFNEHPVHRHTAFAVNSGFGSSAAAAVMAPAKGENRPGKKRVHPRYACTGTVEVAPEGSTMPVWCIVSDISVSGCYAETTSPLPAHTRVQSVLKVAGMEIRARGVVRTSHPGVGMGVSFTHLTTEDKDRLDVFLEKLLADIEKREAAPVAALVPSSFSAGPQRLPQPAPTNDRSVLVAHNRQAEQAPRAPDTDPALPSRLQRIGTELWEVQQMLRPEVVDGRIIREFKDAVDHARQSAWAVQQWLELQGQNRDPFHVIQKLNSERIRAAAEIDRHLARDIDGGEIDLDHAGLDELFAAAKELYGKLSKLLKKI